MTSRGFAYYYGSDARVSWVRRQPSVVSGDRPCVNAHTETGGMGIKAHYSTIVPMTDAEHRFLHDAGPVAFAAKYGVTMDELRVRAADIESEWERVKDRFEVEFPHQANEESVSP